MAQLTTRYEWVPATAADGNTDTSRLAVSVLRRGSPVTGLTASDITLSGSGIGPPGSASPVINTIVEVGSDGIYILHVAPYAGATWRNGWYMFHVTVVSGANRGQEVVKLRIE